MDCHEVSRPLDGVRPIAPNNCDIKIVSAAITRQVLPALDGSLHHAQKGGLPGRQLLD